MDVLSDNNDMREKLQFSSTDVSVFFFFNSVQDEFFHVAIEYKWNVIQQFLNTQKSYLFSRISDFIIND